jgi:hypothetical protein
MPESWDWYEGDPFYWAFSAPSIPYSQQMILGKSEDNTGKVIVLLPAGAFVNAQVNTPGIPASNPTPEAGHYHRQILFNGSNVAFKNNITVIVGQQINLTYCLSNGEPAMSNFTWTVNGYAISNYDLANGILYTRFPLSNSTVSFYWVDGGPQKVSCSAWCGGTQCSADVDFTVTRPNAQIMPCTSSVNINGSKLIFANGPTNGITFSNTISGVPTNIAFTTVWAQVVTSSRRTRTDTNGAVHVLTHTNLTSTNVKPPYLDAAPYPVYVGTNCVDSPGMTLMGIPFVGTSVTDHFEMWMMFQPSGGICVPLRAVNWYWSGSATNIAGTWTLQAGATNSVNLNDFPTTAFPAWNGPFLPGTYVPPLSTAY